MLLWKFLIVYCFLWRIISAEGGFGISPANRRAGQACYQGNTSAMSCLMWCKTFTWCQRSVRMGRVRWQWGQVPMSSPPSWTLSEKDAAVSLPRAGRVSCLEKMDASFLMFTCVPSSRSAHVSDGRHLSWFGTHRRWLSSEDFWKPQAEKINLPLQTRSSKQLKLWVLLWFLCRVLQTYLVFLSTLSRNWCLASVTTHSGVCCREEGISWKIDMFGALTRAFQAASSYLCLMMGCCLFEK